MQSRHLFLLTTAALLWTACGNDLGAPTPVDSGSRADLGALDDTGVTDNDAGGSPDLGLNTDAGPTNQNDPANATRDTDCDGLSDAYEFVTVYPGGQSTDPSNADTDGDGLPDGLEAGITTAVVGSNCPNPPFDQDPSTRTSPVRFDSDDDGLADGIEDVDKNGRVDANESNPNLRDTDGDGLRDGIEDANLNGLRDANELDPTNRDSDNDGISDGIEDANLSGTLDPGETDPLSNDTDTDGILDGDEDTNHNGVREPYEIDPRTTDTDCDGLGDAEELAGNTSPVRADTDGDGVLDGVELGRDAPVPGSNCPAFVGDADISTTTDPTLADSDGDGLPDGVEDANGNGRVDTNETNPGNADTDGDGLPDGDEVLAGADPLNNADPDPATRDSLITICSTANLQPIDLDVGSPGQWTVANLPQLGYTAVSSNQADVRVGALDDGPSQIAGFVIEMPFVGGAGATAVAQNGVFRARLDSAAPGQGVTLGTRQSPRFVTSHDGFEAAVSGLIELDITAGAQNPAQARNTVVRMATGLAANAFTGLPTNTGLANTAYVLSYELLVRGDHLVLVGALLERSIYNTASDNRSIVLQDLSNGTALALPDAAVGKACNSFVAQDQSVADFIWMADISASTDDDRGRIVSAAQEVFDALAANNVDFRMGVVPHSQSQFHVGAGNDGNLRAPGFTTDRNTFIGYLQDVSNTDGCEFGLESVHSAVARALPRSAQVDPLKLRDNATLAVVYIADENAQSVEEGPCYNLPQAMGCPTGIADVWNPDNPNACAVAPNAAQQTCVNTIVQKYIDQLSAEGGIAFGQVFDPNPVGACTQGQFVCPNSAQDRNEPGRGYVEVINATGGLFYSPCEPNPGAGSLQAIVDAVSGAASQYQLTDNPVSSTLKVGITRVGQNTTMVVPRDKQDGFDYDPVSNSIFFRGTTYRPNPGDRVTISYRVWTPPDDPCGGPCDPGQACDPSLGVCLCDLGACDANCGPNGICDAQCNCACTSDCNGNCGPNQVCNQNTCQCECPADCGGCPIGTECNPNTCACECGSDCGLGCQDPLDCNQNACACECPSDCGGACGANTECNPSTCECSCGPGCDEACPGNATCNAQANCACECPTDCGGCPDGTICDAASCACTCGVRCDQGCPGNQVCDPNNSCACACPSDCGGTCNAAEICDTNTCACIPAV